MPVESRLRALNEATQNNPSAGADAIQPFYEINRRRSGSLPTSVLDELRGVEVAFSRIYLQFTIARQEINRLRTLDDTAFLDAGDDRWALGIEQSGVPVSTAPVTILNFLGSVVVAEPTPGQINVTVTGGGGGLTPLTGAGNPDGSVAGSFGQDYFDTNTSVWYKCNSNPSGNSWSVI